MKQLKTLKHWLSSMPMLATVALFAPQTVFADSVPLKFDLENGDKNGVEITETTENEYTVKCVAGDPYCATFPLEATLTEDYKYIVFEYTTDQEITNEMEFFFSPWRGGYSMNFGGLPVTSEWKERAVDVSRAFAADWGFGAEGSAIRFDFGNNSAATIQIRNLRVTNENPFATSLEQVDGAYQITNGNDLATFATLVNKGLSNANATLTADIDMTGVTMEPIGNLASLYCGTFDGQGHTISNLTINNPGQDHVGLIGAVTGGATVKNFILDETCTITGRSFVGMIGTAINGGTINIDRVGNEGNVTAVPDGGQYGVNAGGIIGVNMLGASVFNISNCYVTGTITGRIESAAISGWADKGNLTNCWSVATVNGVDGDNVFVRGNPAMTNCYEINGKNGCGAFNAEDMASGRLCYLLNGNQSDIVYTQNLGEGADAKPCLFGTHGQVYMNCPEGLRCDGVALSNNVAYSNEPQTIPAHTHVDGICEVCGQANPDAYEMVDGAYEISTPAQLYWFAVVNNTIDHNRNARLTADIDFTGYDISIGIGYHDFSGVFDGQGHKVTINRVKTDGTDNCSLFECLKGTVKNLWIDGNITSNGKYAAGVASHFYQNDARIENVVSTVVIESSVQGDATNAGILAVADNSGQIVNCVFAGKLTTTGGTECCGGIIGWATNAMTITNSLMIGDIEVNANDTHTISRNFGNVTLNNTWVKSYFGNSQQGQLLGENAVASGEAAYKVGMGQQIDTDAIPTPWNTTMVNYFCNQYTNRNVPEMTAPGAPKLYYIKNTRSGKYVSFNENGNQTQSETPQGVASMYFFMPTGEAEGNFQPVSIYNLAAGEKSMSHFNSWTAGDNLWYILMDGSMSQNGFYIGKTMDSNSTGAWWNDYSGNEIGSWSCDGGSIFAFEVVPAEECPELATVTYNQIMDGKTMRTQYSIMMVGAPMPGLVGPAFAEAETPEGVVEGDITVDLNVTANAPFEVSESFENAKWYEIINTHNTHKYIKYDGEEATVYKMTADSDLSDKYLWSFYGNPYEGYTVMNLAAGEGKYLHVDQAANGANPVMSEEATVWTIGFKDDTTFGLGLNGEWWNRSGGDGGEDLALWQDGPASDLGSTLKVAPVDVAARYVIADASDNVIATRDNLVLVSSMNAIKLTTGVRNAVVDENKQISIYDYFTNEYIDGTVTVDKGIINIALARPVAASKLIYVTVPAEYVTMNGEFTNEQEVKLTYYVHGSDNVEESVIERIMAIVNGSATGIENINGAEDNYNVVSLSGAQVRNGKSLKGLKGLYIVNGKKVILK